MQLKRRNENKILDLGTPQPCKPGLLANSRHREHVDLVAGLWNSGIILITDIRTFCYYGCCADTEIRWEESVFRQDNKYFIVDDNYQRLDVIDEKQESDFED